MNKTNKATLQSAVALRTKLTTAKIGKDAFHRVPNFPGGCSTIKKRNLGDPNVSGFTLQALSDNNPRTGDKSDTVERIPTNFFPQPFQLLSLALGILLLLFGQTAIAAEDHFTAWRVGGDWYSAADAMVDSYNEKHLFGHRGSGVLINGRTGRTQSLITKRRDYRDVEVHLEFMVAKHSNSGVIFHGNYEIQILDSAHLERPTGAHCGGVYPRAEGEPGTPSYHHIDKGSPPRVNAAKPPGQWQSLDIIFQSPRFDDDGNKTANAKFVKVVHNGVVVQENVEVQHAHGPNWDRKQYPHGPVIIQGDYGPIAIRNLRVKDWSGDTDHLLNVPPEGFTTLFNGGDFTGWRVNPKVIKMWAIEDGMIKSHGLLEEWGADLVTEKEYMNFVLMLDFRMPTISDSGINFRKLIPEIPGFGDMEQFNLRSRGGMGHLESYYFLPKDTAKKVGLKEAEKPHVRHIDPEVDVWHTVKLIMQGRTFSAEYDGEVLYDKFEYHDWMMNMEPAPIRLQKHIVVYGENLGATNPCPIEYRNIFIKELERGAEYPFSSKVGSSAPRKTANSPNAQLLARIDKNELPKAYDPAKHQDYVDRRIAGLSGKQLGRISELWQEKQKLDPNMPNRGFSFLRIMEYVAEHAK